MLKLEQSVTGAMNTASSNGNGTTTHHGGTMTSDYECSMWKHKTASGHELLITAWIDSSTGLIVEMTIAERESMFSTWGPPTKFEKVEY